MDAIGHTAKPFEKNLNEDEEYVRTRNKMNQYYKALCENASPRELKILKKFVKCCKAQELKKSLFSFHNGFDTGFACAVNSLEK